MSKFGLFLLLTLTSTLCFSQQITCSPADKQAVENKLIAIDGLLEKDFGKTLVAIGKTFMDTPYVAKTLEIGDTETLVINLQGLDCTTYVENVLAFGLILKNGESSFDDFTETLESVRYKDGELDGYASRLHYFSEWIANNEKKGLLKDITAEIGGKQITKPINFMSTHRDLYPFLKDDKNFEKVKASENYLNNRPICILAQDEIAANEHLIQTGDIIALTTAINGLDITHTGIATREKDGRIHLLHASTGSMKVEVSKKPLAEYLKKIKKNTGIMVARPTN
ncbi:N-acetylmuramoyl-L-alanine amidase-like domain-containing protein [Zobellia nedashkovskayae]|uniref:N-acetylmuramoyl-L-alanine amidase-like domain-containing protein n=1 Tax=Zobellia nedashkovskayae TaxID=2779510 RepID=UPI00188C6ECC|nr:N-acetylmuramoyl-L-alanine amidase-like domain-containing protein [Zobellia nedashkovskayae]